MCVEKLIVKLFYFIVLIELLFIQTSCHKDPDHDTKMPTVIVSGIADNDTIRNIKTFVIEATDNDKIDKVEVFIDENLLTSMTAAPYEVSWTTTDVEDGKHTVKIVATDKSGNATTLEITVVTQNALLTVHVPLNTIGSSRGFIFLSDENGKFLAGQEFKDGETFTLKAPSYNGETFYLTEVRTDEFNTSMNPLIWTLTDIKRGTWTAGILNTTEQPTEPTYAGTAKLNFINASPDFEYEVIANGNSDNISEDNLSTSLPLIRPTGKLFIEKKDPTTKELIAYKVVSISTGTNAPIDLDKVTLSFNTTIVAAPTNGQDASVQLTGFFQTSNAYDVYDLGDTYEDEDRNLTIKYPGTEFPLYYADTQVNFGDFILLSRTLGFYDFTPFTHAFSFETKSNRINFSASGDFDYISFALTTEDSGWFFDTKKGSNRSIVIPELPGFITKLVSTDFSNADFAGTLIELEQIQSYEGLVNLIQSPQGIINANNSITKRKALFFDKGTTTGRKANSNKSLHKPLNLNQRIGFIQ